MSLNRRRFIKNTIASSACLTVLSAFPNYLIASSKSLSKVSTIKFSVIGLNHGHINSQVEMILQNGGQLVSYFAKETDLCSKFSKRYPQAKKARSEEEILEDTSIQLILSASIPVDRAPLGIKVMQHGKDFMVDKPGITTLQQLADVKKVQKETGRIYSINTERFECKSVTKAGELVQAGAIGKVVQTIGLGPHRMNPNSRPKWFFDNDYTGGIICDIGSHQFDQYLFFTGTTNPKIVTSQVGNFNNTNYSNFEDFGDALLQGDGGMGYLRVDWFSPDGLETWGDGRLTILGTEGYIEIRKTIDIAGRSGGNHLFLVNQTEKSYIDCSNVSLPYGERLVDDVINRTETAMSQDYCFLVAELGLLAQKNAQKVCLSK